MASDFAYMYAGMRAQATDAAGNNLGIGSVKSQIDDMNLEILGNYETSNEVRLPHGLIMTLTRSGNNTFVPTFYKDNPGLMGGRIPVRRDDLESKANLPKGAMSVDDIYSWLGESETLQAKMQGAVPVQR